MGLNNLVDRKECACLFTKNQAYVLLEAVERVLVVNNHYELHDNSVADRRFNAGSRLGITNEEENHRSLRLLLLGILSGSVIQANANAGYSRVKIEDAIKKSKISDFQKTRFPVEKSRKQNALEMLSVSAFL